MNHQRRLVLGCAVLVLLLIGASNSSVQSEAVQKPIVWQYKVVDGATIQGLGATSANQLEAGLNELGNKGWELVIVEQGTKNPRFYFKRNAGI